MPRKIPNWSCPWIPGTFIRAFAEGRETATPSVNNLEIHVRRPERFVPTPCTRMFVQWVLSGTSCAPVPCRKLEMG